ncbi:MAG: hypothetical protein A4E63_03144 [Syntrophorhabdus sp. PtaU1.Bin050]|nr:MAG: hypothetical protein A4E63_03144 [Syntrophorhabdus sp. PtaU1.Bin050]
MPQYSVPYFGGKVESLPILFKNIHHPEALFVMSKATGVNSVQHLFSCMTEGRMSKIVSEGNGLHEVFIQR